jgi:hypothetical protein
MADIPTEPVQSEHPCHSSGSDTDQGEHHDGNCCCGDTINLLTPNISAEAIGSKNLSFQKHPIGHFYSLPNPFETWAQFELIRGSPPTIPQLSVSTSTFLAVIQRWLI